MNSLPFLFAGIASVSGNFIFQLITDNDFRSAIERSYFQVAALLIAYAFTFIFK